jgi:hypothetical protein
MIPTELELHWRWLNELLAEKAKRREALRRDLADAKAAGDLGRYRELRETALRHYPELL